METWTPDAVILGGGDYPTHPLPLALLRQSAHVICCDGAARAFIEHEGHAPWRIVGDGDSLPADYFAPYAPIIRRIPEQETNDQTKATRYARDHGLRSIVYVGATGRREDHTLGNIALLMDYHREGLDVRMVTDHGQFIPATSRLRLTLPLGTQLSVFALATRGLRATGLRYPLRDFTALWQGTLNETTLPEVVIEAEGSFLVYICHETFGA